jgi:hypothetical protein
LLVHALEKKSSNVPMLSARISSKLRGIGIIIKIFKDMNQIKLDSFPKLSMKQKKVNPSFHQGHLRHKKQKTKKRISFEIKGESSISFSSAANKTTASARRLIAVDKLVAVLGMCILASD